VKKPLGWIGVRLFHSIPKASREHAGSLGIRDEGLLDSALARPKNEFAYAAESDRMRSQYFV